MVKPLVAAALLIASAGFAGEPVRPPPAPGQGPGASTGDARVRDRRNPNEQRAPAEPFRAKPAPGAASAAPTSTAAAVPAPKAPAEVFIWDVPGALDAIDVPSYVEANGLPVTMHAVRTREKVDALLRHFRARFAEAGLYLPPPGHVLPSSAHPQVTGLDPDTFIAYTIFLQPNPDGSTTVILTETFVAERRRPAGEVAFAPVMPGAQGVLQSHTEGLELLHYRVKASVEQVREFHRAALIEAGYAETEPGVFDRAGEQLVVRTRAIADGELSVSVAHRRTGGWTP